MAAKFLLRKIHQLTENPSKLSQLRDSYFKFLDQGNKSLFNSESRAALLLRFAWHDAGTYNKHTKEGGPNGTIRFLNETSRIENSGFEVALRNLEDLKFVFQDVTYADIVQAGGVLAIEYAKGPKIPFRFGRIDATLPDPTGNLPAPTEEEANNLRCKFNRMGFDDIDIVALSGGHTIGRVHFNTGATPWTFSPNTFNNDYFKELLRTPDGSIHADLVKLPTDSVLIKDKEFRKHVDTFAKDQDAFFAAYAKAHQKLSELGYGEFY